MESESTTKTPIPTRSGFRNFPLCTLVFAFSISQRSTLVETPLQIALFFAKQTQFFQGQTQRNSLCRKGLPEQTTPGPFEKTNPIEPKRTQFIQTQNEHKHSNNKGLCQRTTNNEQRTIIQNEPNQTQFPRFQSPRFFTQKQSFTPEYRDFYPPPYRKIPKICAKITFSPAHPSRSAHPRRVVSSPKPLLSTPAF